MTARSGQIAALFIQAGASTATTGEVCTQVGATAEYYIAARAKAWWDPAKTFTVYDGVTVVTPLWVDWAAGMVTLPAVASGAVTVDCAYFTPEALGGVYGWSLDVKANTYDVTTFPNALNDPVIWKSYMLGLREWSGQAERHFFYGCASVTMDCTLDNSDLIWTLKEWGTPGNLRSVEYLGGTDQTLEVSYNAGTKKFTVQCATTGTTITTTAAQIKAHVEADAVLNALVSLSYPAGKTGAAVVNAKAATLMTGGRDASSDFANIGDKILFRFYLNTTAGAEEILSAVGHLIGVPLDVKLDAIQEANLSFQGEGRVKYHAYPIT